MAQTPRPPIKVGAMIPLTGGGATVGESGQIAVELAVRNINAAGGIAGRQIQLVIGDYQTEATVGVGEAKRLVFQEKIELLSGPTYSQVTLAVLPILNEAKIPSVNVSGSEKLTPEVGPYAFSMLANAEAQSKVMVDYAVKAMKVQSAAILSDTRRASEDRGRSAEGRARGAQRQARRRAGVPVPADRHDAATPRAAAGQLPTWSCSSPATAKTPAT